MNNWKKYLLIAATLAICVAYFGIRFYHIDKRIGFDWDQEQISNQIWDIVKDHKLTLLGPRANNDKGFFLAPYFTYILTPFYLITNLHPYGGMFYLVFFNVVFFVTAFFVLKKLFSLPVALIYLFLHTFNFVLMPNDITLWWPLHMQLGSVLVFYLLYRIHTRSDWSSVILLGIVLGFFINMHIQFVLLGLFSTLFLIVELKKINIVRLCIIVLCTLFMFVPLFIFDIRHQFLNLSLFLGFFTGTDANTGKDIYVWLTVFKNAVKPFMLGTSFYFSDVIVILLSVIGSYYYSLHERNSFKKIFYRSTSLFFILFPFFFIAYGKRPSEYYFLVVFPYIMLTIARFFEIPKMKWVVYIYLATYCVINLSTLTSLATQTDRGLWAKDLVVHKVKEICADRKCNISFDGDQSTDNGFRYLLRYYDVHPDQSAPLIEIRKPGRKGDMIIQAYGIKIPRELK
jgi:hypothetical protein